jgi:hypothetical protein
VERPLILVNSRSRSLVRTQISHKVVTSIANDETQVALPGKVNTGLNLVLGCCYNNIVPVKAACAWLRGIRGWQTGVVRREGPEVCDGVVSPSRMINFNFLPSSAEVLTAIARWPSSPVCRHTSQRRTRLSDCQTSCGTRRLAVLRPGVLH